MTRSERTKLPITCDGNIYIILSTIGEVMRKAGASRNKIYGFYHDARNAADYRAALRICAKQVDMTDWLADRGIEL